METGRISEGSGGSPGLLSSGSDKGESGQFWAENHIAHRGSDNHPEALPSIGFSARFFMDLPGSEAVRLVLAGTGISGTGNRPPNRVSGAALLAENHPVHDPARQEGEQASDDERAKEDRNHRLAVTADIMPARVQDREYQHDRREDRQQMDRAERTDHADLVDPERADRDRKH